MYVPLVAGGHKHLHCQGSEVLQAISNLLVFQLRGSIHVFELSSNVDNTITGHHKRQ